MAEWNMYMSKMGFSNFDAANMLAKPSKLRLVQHFCSSIQCKPVHLHKMSIPLRDW